MVSKIVSGAVLDVEVIQSR